MRKAKGHLIRVAISKTEFVLFVLFFLVNLTVSGFFHEQLNDLMMHLTMVQLTKIIILNVERKREEEEREIVKF